jgi:hypothetical protein
VERVSAVLGAFHDTSSTSRSSGPGGRLLAGLSVSGFHHDMVLEHVAGAVRTSALALSRALGAGAFLSKGYPTGRSNVG